MPRGRRLLIAQRKAPGPLGSPPTSLAPEEAKAWRDIVAAAPDVLRASDKLYLWTLSTMLARWRRAPDPDWSSVRAMYRALGECFVPMKERRRLLFPERAAN